MAGNLDHTTADVPYVLDFDARTRLGQVCTCNLPVILWQNGYHKTVTRNRFAIRPRVTSAYFADYVPYLLDIYCLLGGLTRSLDPGLLGVPLVAMGL